MSFPSSVEAGNSAGESFLKSLPLFSSLSAAQIADLASYLKRRSFAPGVTIFHQDMPGATLYLIETGAVRLYTIGPNMEEVTLSILSQGDVFGLLSALGSQAHVATAITLEKSLLWLLPWSAVEPRLDDYVGLGRALFRLLSNRLVDSYHRLEAMAYEDVLGRLAYHLLSLAECHAHPSQLGVAIPYPLTQTTLATLVGASRESVNRAITTLRMENLLHMDGSYLTILDMARLKRLAEGKVR